MINFNHGRVIMYYVNLIFVCSVMFLFKASSIKAEAVDPIHPPGVESTELENINYLKYLITTPSALSANEKQNIMLREYAFVAASRFIHNGESAVPESAIQALIPVDKSAAVHIAEMRLLSLWPVTECKVKPVTWVHIHYCLRLIREYPSESSLRVVLVLLQRHKLPKLSVYLHEVAETLVDGVKDESYYHFVLAQYKPVADDASVVHGPDSLDVDEDAMERLRIEIHKRIPQ